MVIQIFLNQDLPSFYNYLIICVLEKRGKHQLTDIIKDYEVGNQNYINFLRKYIDIFISEYKHNKKETDFLKEIYYSINNVEVHLTRDNQLIETGNHYVFLLFRLKTQKYINNIKLFSKFKEKNNYPEGDNIITIMYYRDYTYKIDNFNYSITRGGTTYYRKIIFRNDFNTKEKIINKLPGNFLFPSDYIPKPNLELESCSIC